MFQLIPAPLHRVGLRLAHALRRRWWRIAQVKLHGCRVLAFDDEGRVLLIRHSYGSGAWMMPGGGLARNEDPVAGALREMAEEVGCTLTGARLFAVEDEPLYGTVNRVHLVTGRIVGTPQEDGREVIALGLFQPDALPERLSPALSARMADWIAMAQA